MIFLLFESDIELIESREVSHASQHLHHLLKSNSHLLSTFDISNLEHCKVKLLSLILTPAIVTHRTIVVYSRNKKKKRMRQFKLLCFHDVSLLMIGIIFLLLVCYSSPAAAFSAATPNPALSRAEVEKLLDVVPVYAVTEPEKGGIVLVNEKDNDNEIAYFFFSPDTANSVFSPLKNKNENAAWDVTQFSLGLVWFELFKNQQKGIEYRLVPDSRELASARKVLGQDDEEATIFSSAYNEIPVFVDQSLRLQGDDGGKKLPMYFSLQDLLESCQQAGDENYQPTVNVADFCSMVEQMQLDSEDDFRNILMIPPTVLNVGSSRIEAESKNDEDSFTTPTATENWED